MNNKEMNSQRVQYYQCPCCKCGNSHYQQFVSGSMPGSCCPASVAYEVPQRLSAIDENDSRYSKPYNRNDYNRSMSPTPYGEPPRRNGLDEDDDDPDCICPRQMPTRQALPPAQQRQQQQQQPQQQPQRRSNSYRTSDCCVCCGRAIKPYKDNGTVTSQDRSPKACLEKCPATCNPNRMMQVDEEVMVVPTYDSKEVSANTTKAKPCRGSVASSQRSRSDSVRQNDRQRNRTNNRCSNCERCCCRNEARYNERYDDRYNERRELFCGDKFCGGRREETLEERHSGQNREINDNNNIRYNEFQEVCYCQPTCDPMNPACGTCKDIVTEQEKEINAQCRDSQNTMTSQDNHFRSTPCHTDPICSLCQMDHLVDKTKSTEVVDKGVNTMPPKKKCALFRSKK